MTSGTLEIQTATAVLSIPSISCGACLDRIERALRAVAGVGNISVNLPDRVVEVTYQPETSSLEVIKKALSTVGYPVAARSDINSRLAAGAGGSRRSLRPLMWGLAAGAGIIAFYLGLNTLTADWFYAKAQFSDYRWWLVALATGLGAQVALYTALRGHLAGAARKTATSSMATSGGVSATSMAACCAHYLAAFLPAFSAPFFSAAAASLEKYQHYFFLAGIVSCGLGLVVMVRLLKKNGISPLSAFGLGRRLQASRVCH